MVAESMTDRLFSNDPTLFKLHLVHEPSEYFSRPEQQTPHGKVQTSDEIKNFISFRAFLEALRRNTSVTYVFLERRFVRHLKRTEYAAVLHAIGAMQNVREVEIWSVHVPLSTLCNAFSQSRRLDRLGLGMVTLVETGHCQGLAHHATLQTFYLSDFRFPATDNHQQEGQEEESNLDSLLEALGTCPRLCMVEIVNHQNTEANQSSPRALAALASSTSLFHLTLRRVGLQSVHAIAVASAISEPIRNQGGEGRRRRLRCHRPRVLHVDENNLGNAGSIAIVQAIVNYRRQCRRQGLHGGGVKDLSLRNNSIDATGCVAIADALLEALQEAVVETADGEEESLLEKLNLAMNPIEDRGGAALARLLQHDSGRPRHHQNQNHHLGLKQLELSRANMTDVGCCDLARALRDNTSLLVLGLSFNQMKDATYIAFAASLKVNHTLQSINLVSEGFPYWLKGKTGQSNNHLTCSIPCCHCSKLIDVN
jgi:hypothetical protein